MKPSIPVQRLTVLGLVLLIGFGALHRSHSCQPYPPTVRIEAIDPNASEVGPNTGTFRIYRTGGDSSLPLVVYFQEPEGTAQQGNDYEFAPDSMPAYVTIPAWSSYTDVTVTPILDTDCYEGTETVILTLATNANYWIGWPSNATVNIADAELPQMEGPTNQVVCPGGTAIFSVTVTGTGPITYQWYFGSGFDPLQGETNATLVIPDATPAKMGAYYVRAIAHCGELWGEAILSGADDSDGDGLPDCIDAAPYEYDHDPLVFIITAPPEGAQF
jgi:hypothetical protein